MRPKLASDEKRPRGSARPWLRSLPFCKSGVRVVISHSPSPPEARPLAKGMRAATTYHTEMARQLAVLQVAVSLATPFVLGRSPTKAFQADVAREMLTEFQE
jgi:hypothetical protein